MHMRCEAIGPGRVLKCPVGEVVASGRLDPDHTVDVSFGEVMFEAVRSALAGIITVEADQHGALRIGECVGDTLVRMLGTENRNAHEPGLGRDQPVRHAFGHHHHSSTSDG